MTNYAFFDVDQTIYPGYSMADFYLSPQMISRGGDDIYKQDLEIGRLYKSGQITYGEAGLQAAKLSALTVKGMNVDEVHKLAMGFINHKGVKPFVLPLFDLLHQQGYTIILVSGSVDFVVHAIAEYCKADFVHATTTKVRNGEYTGDVIRMLDGHEKAILIKNTYDLTKGHILAFGDSTGDIPMLSLADHAFVINPHQPKMERLVLDHENWYLVREDAILDQVRQVLG